MTDIDSKTLFDGAAAVIATIAVSFFVLNVDWAYSPVSKVSLVVLFLAGIFAITQRTDERQVTLFGYGVVVTATTVLFLDVVETFDVENTLTVFGLLAIAATLFYLRTQFDEDNRFVTGAQAKYASSAVAVLAVGVLTTDIVTGGLSYELRPETEIEIPESRHDEVRVASVAVENPTPFPERVAAPNYAVCTAGNWSAYRRPAEPGERPREVRADTHVQDGYNEFVPGFDTKTYPIALHLEGQGLAGETFPVEWTSSCPTTETGSPYLAIFEAPQHRYGRPD